MNRLLLAGLIALSSSALADDKIRAEVRGWVETEGIAESGEFVGLTVESSALRAVHGKVNITAKNGQVRRIETYTEWSAPNEVRLKMWEKLWVSGGNFVGWVESNIETPNDKRFARNLIEGEIEQEIRESGSGYIEWTTVGGTNGIESQAPDEDDFDEDDEELEPLPPVEVQEVGEFDGVSNRRIEIDSDGELTFEVEGFERVIVRRETRNGFEAPVVWNEEVYVNQSMKLEGDYKGSLAYDPDAGEEPIPSPSPTPIPPRPTPTPGLFPTPTPTLPGVDFDDDDFDFTF